MTKDRNRGITHSKWFLPSFSFVLGLVILAVAWLGGQPGEGVFGLAGLTAFGLFFLLAGRSETIRGLRGDGRDERFAQIDLRATAMTGLALLRRATAPGPPHPAAPHRTVPPDHGPPATPGARPPPAARPRRPATPAAGPGPARHLAGPPRTAPQPGAGTHSPARPLLCPDQPQASADTFENSHETRIDAGTCFRPKTRRTGERF